MERWRGARYNISRFVLSCLYLKLFWVVSMMLYWHAGCFIESTLCWRFDLLMLLITALLGIMPQVLSVVSNANNFIVVKIDMGFYCNLVFSEGESQGFLNLNFSKIFSNAHLMGHVLVNISSWAWSLNQRLKILSHEADLGLSEYFEERWMPGDLVWWMVSWVTMAGPESGDRCQVKSAANPPFPLPASAGDWQVVTLLVNFSHTSTNPCPAFRSKYVHE